MSFTGAPFHNDIHRFNEFLLLVWKFQGLPSHVRCSNSLSFDPYRGIVWRSGQSL